MNWHRRKHQELPIGNSMTMPTLTVRAEELGFDLIFGLAQSPGSEGHGGETAYRKNSLDSMLVAAGKAALTR